MKVSGGALTVKERLTRLEQAINFQEAILVVPAVGTEDTSGGSSGAAATLEPLLLMGA